MKKVDPGGNYTLRGALLNQLIDAAAALQNVTVKVIQGGTGTSKLIARGGRAILHLVIPESDAAAGGSGRTFTQAMTVAGIIPTTTEINTALAAVSYGDDGPLSGDRVVITVGFVPIAKFVATISTETLNANTHFVRSFVVSDVTYYATLHQAGLY